jgi:hypothetical protein
MNSHKKLSTGLSQDEFDELSRKALKAHRVASKLFSEDLLSDECMRTSADFMYLNEEKLDKIIDYIKNGK